jgi:phosphopantothenoylcysteine decarboxylase/phosphopantothenate--cysteine ligase
MPYQNSSLDGKRIIVGMSGGIASYKIADVVSTLVQSGVIVDVLMTEAATRFITPLSLESLSGRPVYDNQWKHVDGHSPQHIKIAERAELMLIAPCTMDMLARVTLGLTDDPVSLVCSAVDRTKTPVLLAPSMNVTMLAQPVTQRNMKQATDDGFTLLAPEDGWQACRADGLGRLPGTQTLITAIENALSGGYAT